MGDTSSAAGGSGCFEIRVAGRVAERLLAWFEAEQLENADDGTTIIRSQMADQAQLHGLIQKVRDMGLPLVSVTRLDSPRQEP